MHTVRWLFVAPLTALGWLITVFAGVAMGELLNRLCPPDVFISGMCMAPWYRTAEVATHAVAAAVGAGLSVALPALVAPAYRRRVAMLAFAAGSLCATSLLVVVGSHIAIPFSSAVAAGLLVALGIKAARNDPGGGATDSNPG
jgi:hypothetical protein